MVANGVELGCIFYSYPYTSDRAKDKVNWRISCRILYEYNTSCCAFTEYKQQLTKNVLTVYYHYNAQIYDDDCRKNCEKSGSLALLTGEAIGQVASQTMESMLVTENAVSLPVYRPLIRWIRTK